MSFPFPILLCSRLNADLILELYSGKLLRTYLQDDSIFASSLCVRGSIWTFSTQHTGLEWSFHPSFTSTGIISRYHCAQRKRSIWSVVLVNLDHETHYEQVQQNHYTWAAHACFSISRAYISFFFTTVHSNSSITFEESSRKVTTVASIDNYRSFAHTVSQNYTSHPSYRYQQRIVLVFHSTQSL